MTTFKYTYQVFGRPKNEKVDAFMNEVSKNFKELSGEDRDIHYNGPLGEFSFQIPDTKEAKDKIPTILMKATEVFEGKFSDVQIKLKGRVEI